MHLTTQAASQAFPSSKPGTVAILAQGTNLALASQQAFLGRGSILAGDLYLTITVATEEELNLSVSPQPWG